MNRYHSLFTLLGAKFAQGVTVLPGQTKTNVGCIIKHALTNNPQALANTGALVVDLIHQINPDQPVSMQRSASDNSTAVVGNALPVPLQGLCSHP